MFVKSTEGIYIYLDTYIPTQCDYNFQLAYLIYVSLLRSQYSYKYFYQYSRI